MRGFSSFILNRTVHFVVLLMMLIGLAFFVPSEHPIRQSLQNLAFDSYNQVHPREVSKDARVVIVDIDDASLAKLGQWPFPRTLIASMVHNLSQAGAAAIAFDGVLAEPDRTSPSQLIGQLNSAEKKQLFGGVEPQAKNMPDHDALLANIIKESGVFVAGFTHGSMPVETNPPYQPQKLFIKKDMEGELRHDVFQFRATAHFLPELERAAAGNGSFMAAPDPDGVLRRTSLLFSDGEALYPSLTLESLRVATKNVIKVGLNKDESGKDLDTQLRIQVGSHEIPIEKDGKLWVYFRHFDTSRDYLSAYKTILNVDAAELSRKVKGRIVLIGSSAEGLKDLRTTAIGVYRPGVEVHANVIEQILDGAYLLRPDKTVVAERLFILLIGILVIASAPFINALWLGGICTGLVALAVAGSQATYVKNGLLIDPFYPGISIAILFLVSVAFSYLRSEAEKKQIRAAFGLYIAPDVMKELTANPDALTLGGEEREVTVMFSDVRNFTQISERLSPEELIEMMNSFLTPMSDEIMSRRGTIDKYMGDAIMAFWNAPLDDEAHARHAALSALAMVKCLSPINFALQRKAALNDEKVPQLSAGIGINTGPAAVGNMGSKQRFAYSVLGDSVNTASRLEGLTKQYKLPILLGEETVTHIPEMAVIEVDMVRVVGREAPLKIYALLGDEIMADTSEFAHVTRLQNGFLAAYRAQDIDRAQEGLGALSRVKGFEVLSGYIEVMETRLAFMREKPHPKNWDGVYNAEQK
ncbi:MAG: CHASE2 domain-containing protein [Pseudobdellovibrionaceae bacterium]